MGGDRVIDKCGSRGRCGGRLLTLALAAALVGISGLAAQEQATSQPRQPTRSPSEQPRLVDQGVSVEPPGRSAKAPAPVAAQPPGRGKAVPPAVRERKELISAARQSAAEQLIHSVESQVVGADLTVGALLEALPGGARAEFRAHLAASPQIGGARFPTPRTAEVQLQAEGAAVVDRLIALTRQAGEAAPIPADELEARLASWRGRTFTATGGSASSAIGPELRARPENLPPEWAGVSEEARRKAVVQAHENAVTELMTAFREVEILQHVPEPGGESTDAPANGQALKSNPLTVDKALARGHAEQDALQWLSDRPVSGMRYTEDRKIEVRLALEPAEWVEHLKVTLSRPDTDLPEISEQDWEKLTEKVADLLRGHGGVGSAAAAESESLAPVVLPTRPPAWASQTITLEASARATAASGSVSKRKLLTQQAALEAARLDLRARLGALPISGDQTLASLAETRPSIQELVDGFVNAAQPAAARYHEDGSVTVQLAVTPRSLWQALERRLIAPSLRPQN